MLWENLPSQASLAEQLTWAAIDGLQPRTKYILSLSFFFLRLNPDIVTWMEVWVELGWALTHQRALWPFPQPKQE